MYYIITCEILFQGYKWDRNEVVVEWIEEQLSKSANESIINRNIHAVKRDAIVNQIKNMLDVSILLKSFTHSYSHKQFI